MKERYETGRHDLADLQAIERRAMARPCTLAGLRGLRQELEDLIAAIRRGREVRRAVAGLEAEPAELRTAMRLARRAVQGAIVEHEKARIEVSRVTGMVQSGRLAEAAMLRSQGLVGGQFSDLDLNFVEHAVKRQQSLEQRMFVAALTFTGVLLVIVCLVEILRRSVKN